MTLISIQIGAKRKDGKGRYYKGVNLWVFTLFERRRKLPYFVIVKSRTKKELQALICQIVEKGTIIYSDEWKSYIGLNKRGYHHQTVNHSQAFVSDDGTHLNTLESLHNELKLELKICRGLLAKHVPAFLDEFVFRKVMRGKNMFDCMLDATKEMYNVM